MLDTMIQSLRSEFSLLLSAQLQKLQESNEKWMKLAENLVLHMRAVTEKLKIASASNEDWTIAGLQAHDVKPWPQHRARNQRAWETNITDLRRLPLVAPK